MWTYKKFIANGVVTNGALGKLFCIHVFLDLFKNVLKVMIKSNLSFRKTRFWNCTCLTELLLTFSGECDVFFILQKNPLAHVCRDQV